MKPAFFWMLLFAVFSQEISAESLKVGVRNVPPFALEGTPGQWTGISVELWNRVAAQEGWETEWVTMQGVTDQVDNLAAGKIDVAIGAMSMTEARESVLDFSHPFYSTGLAIATPVQQSSWVSLASQLFSAGFLGAVSLLILVLLGVGIVIWLLERKRNAAQFGGSPAEGIGNGFWWSAVTMTTVGYGDKSPVTLVGRVFATVWMFVSVITISGFTAAIASSVTLDQYVTAVRSQDDLPRVRTVAVSGSTGQQFLVKIGLRPKLVATPAEALALIRNREAEAFVYDEPLLRYLLKDAAPGIEILTQPIEQQYYAFGLKQGSNLQEPVNRALLALTVGDDWERLLQDYLGKR